MNKYPRLAEDKQQLQKFGDEVVNTINGGLGLKLYNHKLDLENEDFVGSKIYLEIISTSNIPITVEEKSGEKYFVVEGTIISFKLNGTRLDNNFIISAVISHVNKKCHFNCLTCNASAAQFALFRLFAYQDNTTLKSDTVTEI